MTKQPTAQALAARKMEELQEDLLLQLSRTSIAPHRYDYLSQCSSERCATPKSCAEICIFGQAARRQQLIAVAEKLFEGEDDIFEVRLSRECWTRERLRLRDLPVRAARLLNRRALDKLIPTVVAVGSIKARYCTEKKLWHCEIHEIVAGAAREVLNSALLPSRGSVGLGSYISIRSVENLGEALNRALFVDVTKWRHPARQPSDEVIGSRRRRQYYCWVLQTQTSTVRYGCDRHLNRLTKTISPKPPRRKRPYPDHLVPYMFGNHPPK